MSTYDSVLSTSFLNSVCFGQEGHYAVGDTLIHFMPEKFNATEDVGGGARWMKKFHVGQVFDLMSQKYASTFVHEMGHSLASHAVVRGRSQVYCHTGTESSTTQGYFVPPNALLTASAWKQTFVDASGPMANVAFCSCKLAAAAAIKNYLGWPLSFVSAGAAAFEMGSELAYAATSAVERDDGDFGHIANKGSAHLAIACLALAVECALGIFTAYSILT